jgi:DNA invertase Pin-like site-specific DNA recombinase
VGDTPIAAVLQPVTAGLRIGYARVSTDDQSLDAQLDALRAAGCTRIYEEKASGRNSARPELAHAIKALRPGDTLVVQRLDRLARSLRDLLRLVTALREAGAAFESLAERIETTTAAGELVFHLFASLAQFEYRLINERTRAGLAAARARGRKGGRRPKLGAPERREIQILLADPSMTVADVARRYGVSRTTIYKHVKGGTDA